MSDGENETPNLRDRRADACIRSPQRAEDAPPLTLAGFWDGAGRLYLTRDQSQYVEFAPEAVLSFGGLDPGQAPFLGEEATWVKLPADAQVTFVRTGPAAFTDEFAPQVRRMEAASEMDDVLRRTRYHASRIYC